MMVPGRETGGASEGTNEESGKGISNTCIPFTFTGLLLGVKLWVGAGGRIPALQESQISGNEYGQKMV